MRVLALLLVTGCVFVPRTVTKRDIVSAGSEEHARPATGPIQLRAAARDASVQIIATRQRACGRDYYQIVKLTRSVGWGFWLPTDDLALVIGIILSPFTLPISAAITGISVATANDVVTELRQSSGKVIVPCPVAVSGAPIALALPSGATLAVATDATGAAMFAIPATEPETGVVTARIEGAIATGRYYMHRGACVGERAADFERSAGAPDRAAVLARLTRCGDVTSGDDTGWQLVIAAAMQAARNECREAVATGAKLRAIDAALYDAMYTHDPGIARCVQSEGARHLRMGDCKAARADAMADAQKIQNLDARGAALRAIKPRE